MLMRSAHVARGLTRRSARGLALATQSNLDREAVDAAENAIRAPTELRFGSPPPPRPHAGDDATAEMARRFDRTEEARLRELWAEASRRFDELERQADEYNRRDRSEAQRRATGQGETEDNARQWLEAAGDGAAAQIARASAHAAGGYLDPSDFAAAPDSPPTPPPIPRPPPGVTDMNDHPGGLEAAMAELFAGLPPTLQDSSSDSDSSEASSDSDASDSSGDVEADL